MNNNQTKAKPRTNPTERPLLPPDDHKMAPENPGDAQTIPVNGYQQVLDMLRIADPSFRDSLLRRLAQRDPSLAQSLRRELF